MPRLLTPWLVPLLVVLAAQTTVTILQRMAPTLAPSLAERLAWSAADIGFLSSLLALGTTAFLIAGTPLVLRSGPVRTLQFSLLSGALGALLFMLPWSVGPMVGSVFIGMSLGPQSAVGSEVLRRHAPPQQQNFAFSLKQSGVSVGGVIAGVMLPWLAGGWSLTVAFAVCALLCLAVLAAIAPMRGRLDAHRDRHQPIHWRAFASLNNLQRPLRVMAGNPNLRRMAAVGAGFALGNTVWFAFLVAFLVAQLGLTLAQAGLMFALMQLTSAVGRPLAGWLSDRLRAPRGVLAGMCLYSAGCSLLLAAATPDWPRWALTVLMAAAGLGVASWNGVYGAQSAHYAKPDEISASAAASSLFIFIVAMVGPAVFGLIVALGAGYRVGFCLVAAFTLLTLVPLARVGR